MKAILKEQLPIQEFFHDARNLAVRWQNGHESRFDSMWLRDNCPEDRDPRNGQRYVDIPDLPPDPRIGAVKHVENDVLAIAWAGELKHSWFDSQWLWNHAVFQKSDRRGEPEPVIWTGNQASELLWSDYSEVASSDKARWQWLKAIAEYGIAFLQNVPCKDQQVQEVARLAGFIHETNYGRLFDVRSEPNPNNLANTDWGLGLHTDNPYRDPVPGFQILHCLQASAEGGASVFADGFALAQCLKKEDWVAFLVLASTPVRFRFQDATADLSAEHPLLELNLKGELAAVHYNNRSIAPLSLAPHRMRSFYVAYRELAKMMRRPDFEFRIKLQNGEVVVFDNHRVLHGRTAFSPGIHPRHLQGCYITRDSLFSNLRVLTRKFQRRCHEYYRRAVEPVAAS